jgi:arylsulfatase A
VKSNRHLGRREFIGRASGLALGGSAVVRAARAASAQTQKPNFLFILVDDLGWADLSCYGSTFHQSPRIDQLAREGMRFTDAYAACPVCSPTRASILTGKYPATLNLTDFIPGHWRPWAKLEVPEFNQNLPLDEVTLPEALSQGGYVSAAIGKWHLGGKGSQPQDHGFDHQVLGAPNANDKQVAGLTAEALKFMEGNREGPFLLYLAHHTVHIPLEARQELIDKYESRAAPEAGQRNATYAAMIETLDESTAQLLDKLEELGIADRTVVVFFSDNGGLIQTYTGKGPIVTSNAPLREEKGTLYEGGTRVPLIVRWPGVAEPGSECSVPVTSVDLLPTMLQIAGIEPGEHPVDGKSILPLLRGKDSLKREALYWHYPHYHHCAPCGSIRRGKYKLIEYYEDGALELYDLEEDIGEQSNLADQTPKRAADLQKRLSEWRESVNAQMPTPNPDYDPERAHEWGDRSKKPK